MVDSVLKTNPTFLRRRDPVSGWGPMTIATCRGFEQVQKVLERHGLPIPRTETLFSVAQARYAAEHNGNRFLAKWILGHQHEVNTYADNLLAGAVLGDNLDGVILLLKYGANPNQRIKGDTTPFIIALKGAYKNIPLAHDRFKIIRRLSESGGHVENWEIDRNLIHTVVIQMLDRKRIGI